MASVSLVLFNRMLFGSLTFFTMLIQSPISYGPKTDVRGLKENKKYRFDNQVEFKSLTWNYPSSDLQLQFWEEGADEPYATLTGPEMRIYQATLAGFKNCGNLIKCDIKPGYEKGNFFASDEAYMIVVSRE